VSASPAATDLSSLIPEPPRRLPDGLPSYCAHCDVTLDEITVEHEQTLVLASCCPLCDGPLTTNKANDNHD
jgi:hypothetical protein